MDEATYARMPASIQIREVEVTVPQPGSRVEVFVVVTTLLDADEYTRDDLADLYHERWLAELDIRAIKCSLGMDVLRCKSPEMVHKEIWTGLLAYNLVRQTMLQAAYASGQSPRDLEEASANVEEPCPAAAQPPSSPRCLKGKRAKAGEACRTALEVECSPREISFTAAMQKLAAGWVSAPSFNEAMSDELRRANQKHLPHHRVRNRPNRVEPRAIKRRPKPHKLMKKPRAEARADLLRGKT
jgi:DDE family transposase